MESAKDNLLRLDNLPKRCYNLGDNMILLVSVFNNVPRMHIRQYVTFGNSTLYPTRKGVTFYFREWKFLCPVLKSIQQKYEIPLWGGVNTNKEIETSAFGINVTYESSCPGTFSLRISKEIVSKSGKTFSFDVCLNEKQSETLSSMCVDAMGDFVEQELLLKVNALCAPPALLDYVFGKRLQDVNTTFRGFFIDEMHKQLNNTLCTDLEELYNVMISIDISVIIDETMKHHPNIPFYYDLISVDGFVKEMVKKFYLDETLECC